MKKLFFTALLTLLIAGATFAGELNKLNAAIPTGLKNESAKASKMSGKTSATVLNDQGAEMLEGQKTGENQLPVQAKRTFAKMFEGYQVKQAQRVTGTKGEVYYISAENEKESIIVKIDDDLDISVFKKLKN